MNGKGDKRRPMSISYTEYEKRWDEIFGSRGGPKSESHHKQKKTNEIKQRAISRKY